MILDISEAVDSARVAGYRAEAGDVDGLVRRKVQVRQREAQRRVGQRKRLSVVIAVHVHRAVGYCQALVNLTK